MGDLLTHMLERLPFAQRPLARQFVKFSLVGVTNTIWDFATYTALTRGWFGFSLHYLQANFFAFFLSVLNSYYWNKRWTFRHEGTRHHVLFTKFFLVNLVTLGFYELLLYLLVDRAQLYDLAGKGVALLVMLVWNFGANRLWTFRAAQARPPL